MDLEVKMVIFRFDNYNAYN